MYYRNAPPRCALYLGTSEFEIECPFIANKEYARILAKSSQTPGPMSCLEALLDAYLREDGCELPTNGTAVYTIASIKEIDSVLRYDNKRYRITIDIYIEE